MNTNLLFVAAFNFFAAASQAQTCPIGLKNDHLTIQQVMINYGRFVGHADHIALLGARYPNETVTEEQIAQIVPYLLSAAACAQAVLDNPTGDLLPSKTSFLKGEERINYINDFLFFTEEFRDVLIEYSNAFLFLSQTSAQKRNWESIYQKSKEVDAFIDRAHRKISRVELRSHNIESLPPAGNSLKANMKEINVRYKQINSSVSIVEKNETNALLAGEMAQIFQISQKQIPEAINRLPETEKLKAIAEYTELMQQGVDLSRQLELALVTSNANLAQTILAQLKKLKLDGHGRFDP